MQKNEKEMKNSARAEQRRSLTSSIVDPLRQGNFPGPFGPTAIPGPPAPPQPPQLIGPAPQLDPNLGFGPRQFPMSPANHQFPQSPANEQFPQSPANEQFPMSPVSEMNPNPLVGGLASLMGAAQPFMDMAQGAGNIFNAVGGAVKNNQFEGANTNVEGLDFKGAAEGQDRLKVAQKEGKDKAVKELGYDLDQVDWDDTDQLTDLALDPKIPEDKRAMFRAILDQKTFGAADKRATDEGVDRLKKVNRALANGFETEFSRDSLNNLVPQDRAANQQMHDARADMAEHFGTGKGIGGSVGQAIPTQAPKTPAEKRAFVISGKNGEAMRARHAARRSRDKAAKMKRAGFDSSLEAENAKRLTEEADRASKIAEAMKGVRRDEQREIDEILDDPTLSPEERESKAAEISKNFDEIANDHEVAINRGIDREQVTTERTVREFEQNIKKVQALAGLQGQQNQSLTNLVTSMTKGLEFAAGDPAYMQAVQGAMGLVLQAMQNGTIHSPEIQQQLVDATKRLSGFGKPKTGVTQGGDNKPADKPAAPSPENKKAAELKTLEDELARVEKKAGNLRSFSEARQIKELKKKIRDLKGSR